MTRISSIIAATLIASASFAGAALAANEGDYHTGVERPSNAPQIDRATTGSISNGHATARGQAVDQNDSLNSGKVQNRGDYYEGANRPN